MRGMSRNRKAILKQIHSHAQRRARKAPEHRSAAIHTIVGAAAVAIIPIASAPRVQAAAAATPQSTASAAAIGILPNALAQIQAMMAEKAARTPIQRKIASTILFAERMAKGQPIAQGVRVLHVTIADDISGRLRMKILGTVTPRLLSTIASVGGTVQHSYPSRGVVYAMIDVRAVETIAALPEVIAVRRPPRALHGTGPIDTEGDTTHNAILARAQYGANGAGVTVGVLSDSVNALGSLTHSIATGEITAPVTVLEDYPGGTDEGDAMLEIVADLAPQSPLYFATADDSEEGFADNIVALQQAGCGIVADDATYTDEPVYQDGIVAQAVNTVIGNGALYFSAAGNNGNVDAFSSAWLGYLGFSNADSAWEGPFLDSGYAFGPPSANLGDIHSFAPTLGTNGLFDNVLDSDYQTIGLEWSDPFNQPTDDYDLYVLDSHGANLIAASTDRQDGGTGEEAIEFIDASYPQSSSESQLTPGDRIYVVRYHHDTTKNYPQRIFLTSYGDGINPLYFATDGITFGHSSAVGAYAVAAAPAASKELENYYYNNLTEGPYPNLFTAQSSYENFSSAGPRTMFYDANGNYLQPNGAPVVRLKPDVTAADGVMTSLSGFNPFYGTSAATPHAAAIAALLKSHAPKLTPSEIRATLTGSALHTDTSVVPVSDIQGDWNANMGYGIVMAKAALDFTGSSFVNNIVVKNITISGAVISWQTNLPATGLVEYTTGTPTSSSPTVAATNDTTGLMHSATLTRLTAKTKYNFVISSTTVTESVMAQSAPSTFTTSP
jgi:hypothetical protein